jgi:hypothetical protein
MILNELAENISLEGAWQFSLGKENSWNEIQVPGCWEAQGYSKFIDGPALYRKIVNIPAGWAGKRIFLELDAVSYFCSIYLNGQEIGHHIGLWTPFKLELTGRANPGTENLIEFEIWKPGERFQMRSSLAGFLPDVATSFGGIWQSARLSAVNTVFTEFSVSAEYASRSIHVQAQVDVPDQTFINPVWNVEVCWNDQRVQAETWTCVREEPLNVKFVVGQALPWTPEDPNLYSVRVSLFNDGADIARATSSVGFRQLSVSGDQLILNGHPIMVRGILSWGWVPERICPTYSREQAREEIRRIKTLGFNLIKMCLVIPSPEYLEVADEEGMLIWEELPMWLPVVTNELRAQAPIEYAEIARLLAHHPSIVLYSLGCELNQDVDGGLIDQLNTAVRKEVNDVLLCDNSGSGESYGGLDFDLADFTDYHPYYDLHYFESLLDNWRRDWQTARPWIFGEFCDSDTFRNLNEIIAANHGKRPWWLTAENPVTTWRNEAKAVLDWEDRLDATKHGKELYELVQTSIKQSYTIRKYTLETLRRRSGMGGYIVTGLRDTPISTSGIWDDFGKSKWTPEEFIQINGEAVLTLDVVRRRLWRFGGDRPDRVDPHNYWSGEQANWYLILTDSASGFPAGSQLNWSLVDLDGKQISAGKNELLRDVLPGRPVQVGNIRVSLPEVEKPLEMRLNVQLYSGDRSVNNSWPMWVYPQPKTIDDGLAIYDPSGLLPDFGDWFKSAKKFDTSPRISAAPGVMIVTALDKAIWDYIQAGGRVLLLQLGEGPLPVRRAPFWRESVNLFSSHPVWEEFPQQGFTDLQFFGLATDLVFDSPRLAEVLPPGTVFRPIMRRLDAREFHLCDYVFEATVGQGLLIGCTLRLQGGMGAQPLGWNRNVAGGAMLQVLLYTLLQYPKKEVVI